MRLPGFQCLDSDTKGLMALGTTKVKALRGMSRKERLEEALRENRKCWVCGGRCGQKNPPCAPNCSLCGNTRAYLGITYRLWIEAGGEAATESPEQLYEKAIATLKNRMNNAENAFPLAVFHQQLTDCERLRSGAYMSLPKRVPPKGF